MAGAIVLLVALDQWAKHLARIHLAPLGPFQPTRSIVLIEGFFGLNYTKNSGMAFGLLEGWRWFFVVFTVIVLGVIVYYESKLPHTNRFLWIRIPMAMIVAGTVGNFIDRLMDGYVVDMFQFLFINFPIFNVADILLTTGTFIFAFVILFIIKEPFEMFEKKAAVTDGSFDGLEESDSADESDIE